MISVIEDDVFWDEATCESELLSREKKEGREGM